MMIPRKSQGKSAVDPEKKDTTQKGSWWLTGLKLKTNKQTKTITNKNKNNRKHRALLEASYI